MNDRELLAYLADAARRDTPDVLDHILLRCEQIDQTRQKGHDMTRTEATAGAPVLLEFPPREQKRKRSWAKWAAAAAAVVLAVFGTWFGVGYYTVDSVIDLDVNPSIELRVNRGEKVLSAVPLNADAQAILGDMQLKGVDLDIAVNALIGSMLKNGHVSEIKNSILISVENADSARGAELQRRLSEDVSSLLDAYAVGGAVLSQTVTEDERLKALATEHGISLGKAALVDLLVSQDERLAFGDIARLPINDINLLIANKQADLQGVDSSGQASSGAYIGEAKARAIALERAGLEESQVTFAKAKLDYEDGRMVYEVEFHTPYGEYEYEIDALNGQIVSQDVDRKAPPAQNPSAGYIGEAKAKSIALAHAGVKESGVTFFKVKLDRDDDQAVYDIEFYSGNAQYDYEIDAQTGEILEHDRDIEEYDRQEPSGGASQGSWAGDYIGKGKAKSIALAHAGLQESEVIFFKVKLDRDDGRAVYDIEFYSGSAEYDYEIDAQTGEILEHDREIEEYDRQEPSGGTSQESSGSGDYIGEGKAKSIALAHAGLQESDVTRLQIELDRDDGRMIYDVEFQKGNIEYEYEIDAVTGNILQWDSDYDD